MQTEVHVSKFNLHNLDKLRHDLTAYFTQLGGVMVIFACCKISPPKLAFCLFYNVGIHVN